MRNTLVLFLFVVLFGCTVANESERSSSDWVGSWRARWETSPESYPDAQGMAFYMNGHFLFTEDSLTIRAHGFKQCIFNADTLAHTQTWHVSSDTLFLFNYPEQVGMTYKIISRARNQIKLQLLEDIFVTLTR